MAGEDTVSGTIKPIRRRDRDESQHIAKIARLGSLSCDTPAPITKGRKVRLCRICGYAITNKDAQVQLVCCNKHAHKGCFASASLRGPFECVSLLRRLAKDRKSDYVPLDIPVSKVVSLTSNGKKRGRPRNSDRTKTTSLDAVPHIDDQSGELTVKRHHYECSYCEEMIESGADRNHLMCTCKKINSLCAPVPSSCGSDGALHALGLRISGPNLPFVVNRLAATAYADWHGSSCDVS